MTTVFIKLLNMSIAASWLVLAVILFRIILKNAPKWIRCILWGLVAFKLIFPFSIESIFSLLPSAETIPQDIMYADKLIQTGVTEINNAVNPYISESMSLGMVDSVNTMQAIISLASLIWVVGMIGMFVYAFVSFMKIKNKVDASLHVRENIFLSDYIDTPFVLGVLRPIIYIPSTLAEDDKVNFVIAHEKAHIRRRDHWWKPFGFLLLSIYWFNPVIWIAYILLCRDIELACDEYVIDGLKATEKKAYCEALLSCSMRAAGYYRNMISACPLAFGEVGVKDRVKAVSHYKRPTFWLVSLGMIGCIIVAICFLTNPKENTVPEEIIGLSYKDFQKLTGITAELYHANFYLAEIPTLDVTAIFLAEGWDDENAMVMLRKQDKVIRLEGRLAQILDETIEESSLSEFMNKSMWNNKLVDYRIEEGAGTAYYVADRFVSIKFDLNEDGVADRALQIALNNADTISPDAYCWLSGPVDNTGYEVLKDHFKTFLQGGQIDEQGFKMAKECQKIIAGMGEDILIEIETLHGQEWFQLFYATAKSLEQRCTKEELQKEHPAVLILLEAEQEYIAENGEITKKEVDWQQIMEIYKKGLSEQWRGEE